MSSHPIWHLGWLTWCVFWAVVSAGTACRSVAGLPSGGSVVAATLDVLLEAALVVTALWNAHQFVLYQRGQ